MKSHARAYIEGNSAETQIYPFFGVLEVCRVRAEDAAAAEEFCELLLLLHQPVTETDLALLKLPEHTLTL